MVVCQNSDICNYNLSYEHNDFSELHDANWSGPLHLISKIGKAEAQPGFQSCYPTMGQPCFMHQQRTTTAIQFHILHRTRIIHRMGTSHSTTKMTPLESWSCSLARQTPPSNVACTTQPSRKQNTPVCPIPGNQQRQSMPSLSTDAPLQWVTIFGNFCAPSNGTRPGKRQELMKEYGLTPFASINLIRTRRTTKSVGWVIFTRAPRECSSGWDAWRKI
jgi:hypothetical protein